MQCILNTIYMASLVTVGCEYTRADQAVADVISCTESCLNVGTVLRININSKVDSILFCQFDLTLYNIVVVRAAGILRTMET